MSSLVHSLGPDGPFAKKLPGYEVREGQLEMARAVEAALEREHVLFCEAGTGTGKTFAYLVPAVASGKKVVISTATRALQDQLLHHDIPLVEEVLGRSAAAVGLKGLGNYVCRRRLSEFAASPQATATGWGRRLQVLSRFAEISPTGDVAEIDELAEDDEIFSHVVSSSETRIGPRCGHFESCFVTRARRAAEAASIVVTNHHLFFADLALRGPHPGRVLPEYDAVIFDEAHQLEDVATQFFGDRVSSKRIAALIRDTERSLSAIPALALSSVVMCAKVQHASDRFFSTLLPHTGTSESRFRLDEETWTGAVLEAYHAFDTALMGLEASAEAARSDEAAEKSEDTFLALESVARRTRSARDALANIVEGASGRVSWMERGRFGAVLSSSAVDLSNVLRERVFDRIPSVTLTSATLATHGDAPFQYLKKRLGAEGIDAEVRELVVASPFDFKRNALLYLAKHLPPPGADDFIAEASREIEQLVVASDGGAFVLCTSLASMTAIHRHLAQSLGDRPLLLQGAAPKAALLARFRVDARSVLVATSSFWEGVDVPGRALRLVVLEKVPFSVPSDPLVQARALHIEEQGGQPFRDLLLPSAQMMLKQGFGRLIRTRADRGVVALLDSRVLRRGYGQALLSPLPPARRVVQLELACRFLEEMRPGAN